MNIVTDDRYQKYIKNTEIQVEVVEAPEDVGKACGQHGNFGIIQTEWNFNQ